MIQLVCVCVWWESDRENLYVLLHVLQKCVLSLCVCVSISLPDWEPGKDNLLDVLAVL